MRAASMTAATAALGGGGGERPARSSAAAAGGMSGWVWLGKDGHPGEGYRPLRAAESLRCVTAEGRPGGCAATRAGGMRAGPRGAALTTVRSARSARELV